MKYSTIQLFGYAAFFGSGIIFIICGLVLNNTVILLLAMAAILRLINGIFLTKRLALFLGMYLLILSWGLFESQFYNIAFSSAIKEFAYYMKPILFFIIGLVSLSKKSFEKVCIFTFLTMVIGTIFVLINSSKMVEFSSSRLLAMGYDDKGIKVHIWSFNILFANAFRWFWPTENGSILRNPTFMLSPLDSGYILAFLSLYFLLLRKTKKSFCFFGIISFLMLVSTFVRSALIMFFVALLINSICKSGKFAVFYIILIVLVLVLFVSSFYNELQYIFLLEGSASIHNNNLIEGLQHIAKYWMGTGIGSSGWQGDPSSEFYVYSEGSLFTSIIENGFAIIMVYATMWMCLYYRSKFLLFPIYIGYLTASMLIPIGFSTGFNLLFFSAFGIIVREYYLNKSNNSKTVAISTTQIT